MPFSKREYLLAQIRQKDAIIESLLKQVRLLNHYVIEVYRLKFLIQQLHNPYIATPLSIASYRMATSPSDQNNRNILAWLDRLQSSVRNAGGTGGPGAFKLDTRAKPDGANDDDSDDESETHKHFGSGHADLQDPSGDDDGTVQDPDKSQSLPESHVPLGLIANLSLSNSKKHSSKRDANKELDPVGEENLDDDNVVCFFW